MDKLQVVPINLERDGIEKIAENTVKAFPEIFNGFEVLPGRDYRNMIHPDQQTLWKGQDPDGMMIFLTLCDVDGYVLGVTGLPLANNSVLGGKFYYYGHSSLFSDDNTALVSVYKPEMADATDPDFVRRASAVGIHEVGHIFGLEHHEGKMPVKTSSGKDCPMDRSTTVLLADFASRVGFKGWEWYLDRRDLRLCDPCYEACLERYGANS